MSYTMSSTEEQIKWQYNFLISGFGEKFGGLTNAVFKKTRLLSEQYNIHSNVLTFNFMINIHTLRENLISAGKLASNVQLLNMFEFYEQDNHNEISFKSEVPFNKDEYVVEHVKKVNGYRYYRNGIYEMYRGYNLKNQLKFVDYFNESRNRIRKEEYDDCGHIRKVTYMDTYYNTPKNEMYYRRDGSCYLSFWYQYTNNTNKLERINWFSKDKQLRVFKSEDELQNFWLSSLIDPNKKNYFVCEKRKYDYRLLDLPSNENIYRIWSHHGHDYPKFPKVLGLANQIDAIVFLTEGHKKDVEHRFGRRENYFVIPNSYSYPQARADFRNRDLKRVVSMARYDKGKNLDQMIKAFKIVVEKIPNAVLDLYGFGAEEKNLAKLIDKLQLKKNVFLRGFTDNPIQEYETAALSLSTSESEGFSLSMLESLAHGCPVVSYDIRYGPSDIIKEGKNGYLVEQNNIKIFAERIIYLLENPSKLLSMSEAAYDNVQSFSDEMYIDRWMKVFDYVTDNKQTPITIDKLKVEILDKRIKTDNGLVVHGKVSIEGVFPSELLYEGQLSFIIKNRESTLESLSSKERITDDSVEFRSEINIANISLTNLMSNKWDMFISINWRGFYIEKKIGTSESELAFKWD